MMFYIYSKMMLTLVQTGQRVTGVTVHGHVLPIYRGKREKKSLLVW